MAPPLPNGVKCAFHRAREKCGVADCHNQTYARGFCVRHGGKKPCASPGCDGNVRIGEFCCKHATSKGVARLCSLPGCVRTARVRGKCVKHGGGPLCSLEECSSYARIGGFCQRHRQMYDESKAPPKKRRMTTHDDPDVAPELSPQRPQPSIPCVLAQEDVMVRPAAAPPAHSVQYLLHEGALTPARAMSVLPTVDAMEFHKPPNSVQFLLSDRSPAMRPQRHAFVQEQSPDPKDTRRGPQHTSPPKYVLPSVRDATHAKTTTNSSSTPRNSMRFILQNNSPDEKPSSSLRYLLWD
ncbi:Aste57867_23121 [Aphanomyces stellatus]|uniref:Aste57867_23121 protein n=1 Tax=Aphanomyces stellatus TaxID=120398 RepID=A0A485LMB8_9STRA|nr:hypothetical protein As57867_023050 [Aphanomyces stellatus]VFT99769.1 Aste57867_23121 [Aphanomyces stellatus]